MFCQDNEMVAKGQAVMLDILLEVTRICDKHGITYWLDSGTLLGAVRHKGFIPWDDDMDIGMPRKDYEKFLAIVQDELSEGYFFQIKETDPLYPLGLAKVRKLGTKLVETRESDNEPYCQGIYIDIFPYTRYKSLWFMKWVKWGLSVRDKRKIYKKGTLKRTLMTLYTNVILALPIQFTLAVVKYCKKHPNLYRGSDEKLFSYDNCDPVVINKESDFLPVQYVENVFEGHGFYLPNKPETVLRNCYGASFMELPPVHQRKAHAKKIEC